MDLLQSEESADEFSLWLYSDSSKISKNVNPAINILYESNNVGKIWNDLDTVLKHEIILQIWKNKTKNNVRLASEILKVIRTDESKKDIRYRYINLLCILLARSHDFKYLKDIIETKIQGDLFFYVDSNLLFEFSPLGKRETCIKDTLNYFKTYNCNEKWFKQFLEWVERYSSQYDETVVIKYWNKYKEPGYDNFKGYY